MATRYRDFAPQSILPSTWTDALEDLLSGHAGGLFRLSVSSATTVRVVAGADQARVTISINGKPRWIEADVTATVSGGAGVKDVWVTSAADSFSYTGDDEIDGTDHSFALKVGSTPSGSGAETNFRKVGEVDWDGSKITGLRQSFGNGAMVHVLGQNADVAPIYAKGVASQAKLIRLDDDSAAEQFSVTGAGVVNAKTGYKVNGTDLASTHLSDGSTLAPKASPALTGTPTAPTPATLDDTTKIATTAFVNASINERGARRGKCVIAASEARTNTAFGTLTTPDQITGIVMPTDGLVLVGYEAQVKETVADAARAAIFLGSNQTVAPAQSSTSPVAIAARSNAGVAGAFFPVVSCPSGLVAGTPVDGSTNTGFATTGQALAIGSTVTRGEANTTSLAGPAFAGGFCVIEAAAGTYTVSVQYRATSGTVTAQNRKLWVLAIGF